MLSKQQGMEYMGQEKSLAFVLREVGAMDDCERRRDTVWLKCQQVPSGCSGENRLRGVGGKRGMEATGDQRGGDCRWEMMEAGLGGGCEGKEAGWDNSYTWKVKPSGGANRSGI